MNRLSLPLRVVISTTLPLSVAAQRRPTRTRALRLTDAREPDPHEIDWDAASRSFPYALRQDPAPQNALGQVKLDMPNPFAVYLHDTPDRHLFDTRVRAYSSG